MTAPRFSTFLDVPTDPRWSSDSLRRSIDAMPGDPLTQSLSAIGELDDIVDRCDSALTLSLVNFARDVTLYGYDKRVFPIADPAVIDRLLRRFTESATPHRALLIALIVDIGLLESQTQSKIIACLRGTAGERFLDPE
ncbi:MAG: hypothetical protein HKN47_04000, partial [Pirellulaceae bacterium]|nr:hypothetical protein [Pirellulaceae bacterium]